MLMKRVLLQLLTYLKKKMDSSWYNPEIERLVSCYIKRLDRFSDYVEKQRVLSNNISYI